VDFLKEIFLFEDLGARAVALIAAKVMEKSYQAGEVIFQEGDMGRACFIVAEGRVDVVRTDGSAERTLATMEAGDFFGEMTLLDELPRSATARATEPSQLYILYKTHLDDLSQESPRVATALLRNLARLLSARLRRQNLQSAVDSTLKETAGVRVR
jgi:CRP-like cAMP-binding protein